MRRFVTRITVALLTFTAGVALTIGLLAIRYKARETAISRVAVAIDVNPLEAAERAARTRASDPSYLIAEIATRYADISEFDRAINLVNTVTDDSERAAGKAKIAARLWKHGDKVRAFELFNSLRLLDKVDGKTTPRYATYLLGIISEQLAAAGQYDRVLELASSGGDDFLIRTTLDAVVDNYSLEAGYTGESKLLNRVTSLAKRMTNGEDGRVIQKVALIYAKAEQYERAVKLAEGLGDPRRENFDRDETLQLIARELAQHGEYERAARLARKTDGYFKHPALADIAGKLIETGRKGEALSLLSEVRRSSYRTVRDDVALAVRYAQAGDNRAALKILDGAFASAKEIGKFVDRDDALRKVAEAYSASAFYDKALAATQVGGYGFDKARALAAVAVEMAKAGRDEEVKRAVGVIEGSNFAGFQKANALSDVAAEYLKAGKVEAAKEVLVKAVTLNLTDDDSDHKDRAMVSIAVKFAESGDFEKAFETAGKIQRVFDKTFALADIGVIQGKSGIVLSDRSRSLLREIANPHSNN